MKRHGAEHTPRLWGVPRPGPGLLPAPVRTSQRALGKAARFMLMLRSTPTEAGLARQPQASKKTPVPAAKSSGKSGRLLREPEIIAAALRLLRAQGTDQFSMRALARELGVSPMALYHYVPSKEELLDKVRNAVLLKVPTPEITSDSWEAQMRAYALEGLLLLSEYPGLQVYAMQRPPTASDVRLARYGIGILLAAGCDARTAALAIKTYHRFIFGAVVLQDAYAASKPRTNAVARGDECKDDIIDVVREIGVLAFRESLEFGIDTILYGLRVQIAAAKARKGK